MRRWRKHFLQDYRHVETGYLLWLLGHFVVFALGLFVPLTLLLSVASRFLFWQTAAFSTVVGALLAATRVYVDHYALCPARTSDEAYRAVQSSLLIWLLFAVGAVFFVAHYASLFLLALGGWIALYALYLHLVAGKKALKPARDELLPSSMTPDESRAHALSRLIDDLLAKRKADFLQRVAREHWNDEEAAAKAYREFM